MKGYVLLLMTLAALAASLLQLPLLMYLAGCLAWLAAVLLFPRLTSLQKKQVLLMQLIGFAGLLYGYQLSGWWLKALEANQGLLSMLASVSFLRLVAVTQTHEQALPRGRPALYRMLPGVHILGSVINFSSIMIMADRLTLKTSLTRLQALVLTRSFALAAQWSPFFAAMGLILLTVPETSLWTLVLVNLPLALIGLLLVAWDIARDPQAADTEAYPMQWQALALPVSLAVSVLLAHAVWPQTPVLTQVSLFSLCFALFLLLWRNPASCLPRLKLHIEQSLPGMSGEALLFISAAVLAAGLGATFEQLHFAFELPQFGPWEAWFLLLALVLVSALGVHPVISISVAGGLFVPWVADPELLALVFLMSWSLGVSVSPLSATNLIMQGRYHISSYSFTHWNAIFVFKLLLIDLAGLHLYGWFVAAA